MSQLTVQNLIIGIIIFGVVMSGVVGIVSSIDNKLLGDRTTEFNESFNVHDDAVSATASLKEQIAPTEDNEKPQEIGEAGWFDWIFGGIWNTIKGIFSSFGFLITAIQKIADFFQVPSYFISGIVSIIFVILIFGVVRAVTKVDV